MSYFYWWFSSRWYWYPFKKEQNFQNYKHFHKNRLYGHFCYFCRCGCFFATAPFCKVGQALAVCPLGSFYLLICFFSRFLVCFFVCLFVWEVKHCRWAENCDCVFVYLCTCFPCSCVSVIKQRSDVSYCGSMNHFKCSLWKTQIKTHRQR